VIAISCEPGNGRVPRGMVMCRQASGMYAPAASADIASDNTLVVLDEAVDTSGNLLVAEDARAYRAGRLFASKILLADDQPLTADNMLVLRQQGILLDHLADDAPELVNHFVPIVYQANGGVGLPVTEMALAGSTYAVADNTFTAPADKEFDKWNTKADGTGTDYEAEDVYPAAAGLTLFAIWKVEYAYVTFDANGGTGTMAAGRVKVGAVYAIPDSTLTPPATKAFDKWNTKADGTGTDYAVAASYTGTAADLALFAVWKDAN